jgi:hypothetical protein
LKIQDGGKKYASKIDLARKGENFGAFFQRGKK